MNASRTNGSTTCSSAPRASKRLGPHDVGSAGERTVGVARGVARASSASMRSATSSLRLGRKSPRHARGGDPMAAEMSDSRAGEDADDLGIGPGQRAHEAQLAACRRDRRSNRRRAVRRLARAPRRAARLVSEQKLGLPLRRGCVVRALVGACQRVRAAPGQLARLLRLTRHEAERRSVDRRRSSRRCGRGSSGRGRARVPSRRVARPPWLSSAMSLAMRAPSAAMSSSSVACQPVALETPRRLFRRAGARQREHGTVLQPEIIGTLGQTLLGEIDCGQQLASPLCVLDSLEPVGGRTVRRRHSHPNWWCQKS